MQHLFTSLALNKNLLDNLPSLGYEQMTDIQAQALPLVLAGKDVIAKAKTGSGKTAAFALGALHQIEVNLSEVQCLVLCPTRELADQVAESFRSLARKVDNLKVLTLCGGQPMGPQISSLSHGAHVVVGTPGRVMDHVLKKRLSLNVLKCLVLDEADRMLDMGFEEELTTIVKQTPTERQTLLFSATYPESIQQLSARLQRTPVSISTEEQTINTNISQTFYEVDDKLRTRTVFALLTHHQPESAMVFCNTKKECQQLADDLVEQGFSALALHGDLEQKVRTLVLTQFENQSARILVATDVAARGLDIKDVSCVINVKPSEDAEVHVHRVGRTGRAEAKGMAITLCSPAEVRWADAIAEYQQMKLDWKAVETLRFHANRIIPPLFQTIAVDGGKKSKLRPGDLLGALTQDADIPGEDIGKIKITNTHSFIAVKQRSVKRGMRLFREGKIKGKRFRARKLSYGS